MSESATSGVPELDEALAGLAWGDNVVWMLDEQADVEPFYNAVWHALEAYDVTSYVTLSSAPDTIRARWPGFDVFDARPGQALSEAAPLLLALARQTDPAKRNLLIMDPLEVMAERWGAETSARFFARCCPQLLALGAIAYWSLRGNGHPSMRGTVDAITQCVLLLDSDKLRIVKAEGHPATAEGSVFRYEIEDDLPVLEPAPMTARLGVALKAARLKRAMTQAQLAKLAGVTPAAISQAERGARGLSLETVVTLSANLHLTVDELLRGETSLGYRLGRRSHPAQVKSTRKGSRVQPEPVLDDPETGLRAYLVRLPPNASATPPLAHKGIELVAVARGLVQITLSTGSPVARQGDTVLIERAQLQSWKNLGAGDALILWILRDDT